MKKSRIKNKFLTELRKVPIIQVACEKCDISRNSIYRWKNSDKKFSKEMEMALSEGEELINDMTEHQLLSLIKDRNWPAMAFWLRHRNPKFKEKVEITAKLETKNEPLSKEDQALLERGLSLGLPNTHHGQPK